jgi:hypothetical protein
LPDEHWSLAEQVAPLFDFVWQACAVVHQALLAQLPSTLQVVEQAVEPQMYGAHGVEAAALHEPAPSQYSVGVALLDAQVGDAHAYVEPFA